MIKITLQNMTIRHKLTAIIMLTSILALSLALCAMVVREYLEAREKMVSNFFTHASIIADNSKAAIAFTNQADAEAMLSVLHATQAAVFACIYDKEGNVFVSYQRSDLTGSIQPPEPQEEGFVFKDGYLSIFKKVVLDDETIGTIYLQGELDEIHEDFIKDLIISVSIAAGVLLLAYFFSSKLQKVISTPILTLAEAATSISEKKDYSIRAAKTSSDELGLLTDAFNKMLEQIQQRTTELSQNNEKLNEVIKLREKSQLCITHLNNLRDNLMSQADISEKFKILTEGIVSIFDADFARVWMIKQADLCNKGCIHADVIDGPHVCRHRDNCLHLMASSGRYTHIDGGHRRIPFGCYKIGRIAAGDDKRLLTNNVIDDPRVHNHEWAKELGLKSFAGYRLLSSKGKVLGVLALFSKHTISPEEDELLAGLAHTAEQIIITYLAEQEVKQLNESLEKRIEQRTKELKFTNEVLQKEVAVRKEAEEKLKKERNFSRSIIETAQAIMLVLDMEGRIVSFNPYMEQLCGYPLDEVKGKDWFELFLPQRDQERIRKLFKNAIDDTPTRANVNPIVAKDGREIEIEWYDKTLKDMDGNITGLLAIGQDITDRKQKEKELQKIQEELIEASRCSGMAEVATDILHNVGNVLNSINVSTTLIHEALANSEIPNLKKVTDMIEEHLQDLNTFFTQDPKGRYVPSYLIKAAKLLANEQQSAVDKLNVLVGDVNHIKTIIKMQQEYAKVSGVEISTTIDRIIEDAIRINLEGLKRHTIRIERDYAELGEINTDKQRVMQILVNLIGNAKYALAGNEIIDKILKIRTYKQDENHLRIEVSDNGIGICRENLTKIFRHGFTTKKDGHGFGLHSGALAAKEMKGSLTAHSEGVGHGATFTLELPLKPAGAMQWAT